MAMNNNVINFEKEKIKYHIKQYEATGYADDYIVSYCQANRGSVSELTRTIDQIVARLNAKNMEQFEAEYNQLIESFSTESVHFKFPTIQSRYRRTTNPVRALFNEVQRILFGIDKFNNTDEWILSLLKDRKFYTQLIQSLESDVKLINSFVAKWETEAFQLYKVKDNLKALVVLSENLSYYQEVFKVINDNN
jgi:hypothetical protein